MPGQVKYAIFAKGNFFDDAGWPYEEKFFGRIFATREEAEKVMEEILDQPREYDESEKFNVEYDEFHDPQMDENVQMEIVELNPEDMGEGGIFYKREESDDGMGGS